MFVHDIMTKDVFYVEADASVNRAFQVCYEHKHSQLPVVEGKKLVGLITEKLLAEVSPSKATSLSVYEINYLLSKTKVSDVMIKKVFSVSSDALLEEAALIMYNENIGILPVVDDGNLCGIITRLDIFKAFIEIMGVKDKGTRIALEVEDHVGVIHRVSEILKDSGINILHISNFDKGGVVEIVLKISAIEVDGVLKQFENEGYKVVHVQTTA